MVFIFQNIGFGSKRISDPDADKQKLAQTKALQEIDGILTQRNLAKTEQNFKSVAKELGYDKKFNLDDLWNYYQNVYLKNLQNKSFSPNDPANSVFAYQNVIQGTAKN